MQWAKRIDYTGFFDALCDIVSARWGNFSFFAPNCWFPLNSFFPRGVFYGPSKMDNPLLFPSLVWVRLVAFTKQPEQILTTFFFANIKLIQLVLLPRMWNTAMETWLDFSYWSQQNCWIVRSQSVGKIFNPYHTVGLHTHHHHPHRHCMSVLVLFIYMCLLISTISGRNSLPTISKMNNANSRGWPIIVLLLFLDHYHNRHHRRHRRHYVFHHLSCFFITHHVSPSLMIHFSNF